MANLFIAALLLIGKIANASVSVDALIQCDVTGPAMVAKFSSPSSSDCVYKRDPTSKKNVEEFAYVLTCSQPISLEFNGLTYATSAPSYIWLDGPAKNYARLGLNVLPNKQVNAALADKAGFVIHIENLNAISDGTSFDLPSSFSYGDAEHLKSCSVHRQ